MLIILKQRSRRSRHLLPNIQSRSVRVGRLSLLCRTHRHYVPALRIGTEPPTQVVSVSCGPTTGRECSGNNRFCWWPIHTDGIYEYQFCHAYTATDRHLQYKCGEYSPCCRLSHRLAARLLGQSIQSSGGRCIQLFIRRWHTWHTFRYRRGEYSTRHNHPEWLARHFPRRQW